MRRTAAVAVALVAALAAVVAVVAVVGLATEGPADPAAALAREGALFCVETAALVPAAAFDALAAWLPEPAAEVEASAGSALAGALAPRSATLLRRHDGAWRVELRFGTLRGALVRLLGGPRGGDAAAARQARRRWRGGRLILEGDGGAGAGNAVVAAGQETDACAAAPSLEPPPARALDGVDGARVLVGLTSPQTGWWLATFPGPGVVEAVRPDAAADAATAGTAGSGTDASPGGEASLSGWARGVLALEGLDPALLAARVEGGPGDGVTGGAGPLRDRDGRVAEILLWQRDRPAREGELRVPRAAVARRRPGAGAAPGALSLPRFEGLGVRRYAADESVGDAAWSLEALDRRSLEALSGNLETLEEAARAVAPGAPGGSALLVVARPEAVAGWSAEAAAFLRRLPWRLDDARPYEEAARIAGLLDGRSGARALALRVTDDRILLLGDRALD